MIIIKNSDGIQLYELDFPTLMAGLLTIQQLTVTNTYTTAKTIQIQAVASDKNQMGTAGSTYNSQFFSTDNVNFSNPIIVTIPASSSVLVYTRYAPASNTIPGEMRWALKWNEV
ncbi:hypothetical protein [Methanobacterium paludis]|uniref:Uncharacterized protein n=1 Tax=Methanobacterium paludis (strain DSM 25820 / JCM 18151 / SWAN1) TaxID=868131 RepID=F6D2Q2_METPW|nr:hypothetical protein [Methanobacterium paludis]AEG18631.1 hypothetical protein MSWAN_1620 [Methanobacterium paludis]